MTVSAAPAAIPTAAAPALRLCAISKRFGKLLANDAISLTLARGEVLALLGENGAGKSTLMAIVFGHYRADAGHIEVFGRPLPPGQPRAALAAGIGMVHQHGTLAENLTVLDNVLLGSEPLWQPFSRRARARQRLLAVAARFGLPVQPDARVGTLGTGARQRVELLKALFRGARILILDEPTATLTPQEGQALLAALAQMVAQGLSVIFISHKLGEVLRTAHRVAVLRQGRLVAQLRAQHCTQAQLAQLMVGADSAAALTPGLGADLPADSGASLLRPARAAGAAGAAVCTLSDVHTSAPPGRERLRGVALALHAGEIVALAGVSGNGQAALAELLCGMRAASAGRVTLYGAPLRANPGWLVRQRVARIPEDRSGLGLIGDLALWENAVLEQRQRFSRPWWQAFWLRRGAARAHAQRLLAAFDVRGAGPDAPARALSGGNMQKLILGRALLAPGDARGGAGANAGDAAPRLIVAHQPTWGLDLGAQHFVHRQLLAARARGAAVLLISDDLDEVLALGDRVAVMYAGRLTPARPPQHWSRAHIGLAMAGLAPAGDAADGAGPAQSTASSAGATGAASDAA